MLAGDHIPQRLVLEPTSHVRADLAARYRRVLVADRDRPSGCLGQELSLATPLHGDEPPHGFIHAVADCEQSMISEDDGFVLTERLADPFALGHFVYHAGVVVEDSVIL